MADDEATAEAARVRAAAEEPQEAPCADDEPPRRFEDAESAIRWLREDD